VRERCALLLRAVNVSGHNRVPMAELRELLSVHLHLQNVATYIASGNVICDAPDDLPQLCARVRGLISENFDVDTPVIARTHTELQDVFAANPFTDAASDKMLHVMFLEGEAHPDAAQELSARLLAGERTALRGRELWIDYGTSGAGNTKLTRSVLDRALGTAGTARNLRTLVKLIELTAPVA